MRSLRFTAASAFAAAILAAATPAIAPAAMPGFERTATIWSADSARELADAIDDADREGLDPAAYGLDNLRLLIADGASPALDAAANAAALELAHDYWLGRVQDRNQFDWHIERSAYQSAQLPAGLAAALDRGEVKAWLKSLLPTDARYKGLRSALAEADDPAMRDRIRVNMERWRWMPRELGANHLYVNVPSYRLAVVDDGAVVSTYTVVVGAKDTPTPLMTAAANSLVVNPWWNVPQSIVKKSGLRPGRGGYVYKAVSGGYAVRQPPGPRNSLGRIKIDMPNEQAIYLHDTPSKALFAKQSRAYSHGCIRVKDIDRLAAELMADGAPMVDEALATTKTATLRLPRQWPVYLVYFTADTDDGGKVVALDDPYARDAGVLAALNRLPAGPRGLQIAAR